MPLHNEADAIGPFLSAVADAHYSEALNITWEAPFVNDGSRDATECQIEKEISKGAAIKLVNLSRNFGNEAALVAGLENAGGDAVIPK